MGYKILFVDDESGILSAITRELHAWAGEKGNEIITAPSARQGLAVIEERKGDVQLVVSDLRMPEMKGSDFLLEVSRKWPDICTILLTGFSETEEIVKAIKAGIMSYIPKPWDREYLLNEIEKALELHTSRAQLRENQKRIREELQWAGEMQRAILRPQLPASDLVEFRVTWRPTRAFGCGGDYYDVLPVGKDKYFLLIGDVAGHGVRAAFVTAILKAVIYPEYVRGVIGKPFNPSDFLSWLNERMNFELRKTSNLLITFFAGILDLRMRTFTYANAGMDHPVLVRDGKPADLPVSGKSLGFSPHLFCPDQTVKIEKCDCIILASDGLSEAGSIQGKDRIQLTTVLQKAPPGPDHHRRILENVLAAAGVPDFADDVTILSAVINGLAPL